MQGIEVRNVRNQDGNASYSGGNEGNQRENLLIGVEMMKKKCGEG